MPSRPVPLRQGRVVMPEGWNWWSRTDLPGNLGAHLGALGGGRVLGPVGRAQGKEVPGCPSPPVPAAWVAQGVPGHRTTWSHDSGLGIAGQGGHTDSQQVRGPRYLGTPHPICPIAPLPTKGTQASDSIQSCRGGGGTTQASSAAAAGGGVCGCVIVGSLLFQDPLPTPQFVPW